jgi:hypothetical protein
MVRRDPAYLDWRFLDNPAGLHDGPRPVQGKRARRRGGRPAPAAGEGLGFLVDVVAPDPDALSAARPRRWRASRRRAPRWWSPPRSTARGGATRPARRAASSRPRADNHLCVILHPLAAAHPSGGRRARPTAWYFTDGDRDDATMS